MVERSCFCKAEVEVIEAVPLMLGMVELCYGIDVDVGGVVPQMIWIGRVAESGNEKWHIVMVDFGFCGLRRLPPKPKTTCFPAKR